MTAQQPFSTSSGPPSWIGYLLFSYITASSRFSPRSEESFVVSQSNWTPSGSSSWSSSVVSSTQETSCNFWERDTPEEIEALNWRIKFCDDFYDVSAWYAEGDADFQGFSEIQNGAYVWSGQGETWILLRPTGLVSMRDFYAFLRARIVSGTEDTCFGLWFRENREGVYHYYICYKGRFGIWYLYKNKWHPMKYFYSKNPTAVHYRVREWNSIGVWVQDSRFKFYLNNSLVDATVNKK